jgi:hypothetical protein
MRFRNPEDFPPGLSIGQKRKTGAVVHSLKEVKPIGNEAAADRRMSKRLFLCFSIEISGVNENGMPFLEHTKTDNISDTGCRLALAVRLRPGDVVNIMLIVPAEANVPPESKHPFEVMWSFPIKEGWRVGARKMIAGKIWKVSFP